MATEVSITSLVLKLHTDLTTIGAYAHSRDVRLAVITEARQKMGVIYEHLRAVEREANISPPQDITAKSITPVAVEF